MQQFERTVMGRAARSNKAEPKRKEESSEDEASRGGSATSESENENLAPKRRPKVSTLMRCTLRL